MATTLALTAITVAVALALLLRAPAAKAGAMGIALLGTPVILIGEIWDSGAMERLRDRPLVLLVLLAVGLAVVVAGSMLVRRRPGWLPLVVAAVLPFRIPIDVGDAQPVNLLLPLYVVIGAAALAWVWDRIREESAREVSDPRPVAAEVALLLVVVLYAVQSEWSIDQGKAIEQIAFFYMPFAMLYVVLRSVAWTTVLATRALVVSAAVALGLAAIGFYEYATRTVLLNPKIIASNQIEDTFRVNSLFFDPNIYGRFLALVMLGLAAWLLWSRASRIVAILGVVLVVLWAALVITYSQTSFVALLGGLAILGGLRWGPWRALGVAAVALVIGMTVTLATSPDLDDATSGRVELIGGGIGVFADHPVKGAGSGAFERAYREAQRTGNRDAVAASHTIPVTIAAEQGLIGLAAYLALIVLLIRRLIRAAETSAARAGVAAMTVALIVHTLGYASFLEDPALWVLIAVGMGLSGAGRPRPTSRRERPAAPAAPAA
ncbi:MAG: O-antigen ligase family protein [Solirubrobacteraceae bacterium]